MDSRSEAFNSTDMQMLTLILSENQSHKCIRLIKEQGAQGGVVTIGRGTVSSMLLNLLGIKSQRKDVVRLLLNRQRAEELMDYFDEVFEFAKPGHGIAYTTPVIGAVGLPEQDTGHQRMGEQIGDQMGEQMATKTVHGVERVCMFKKLTVIVDRGLSGDVMDIALKAGVRGGTILHGRGAGAEMATSLFGVEIEPEKELVIILTPDDLVDKVVQALSEGLHLDEPAKGILFVEPILDARGLFEMRDKKAE